MSDPFIGEIKMVGFDYAPPGWAQCLGQLMPIQQNSALFSLLGVSFGGNGVQTFGLPDLRGRSPVGLGQGPGLQPVNMGAQGGAQSVTLTSTQMPMHTHVAAAAVAIPASGADGTTDVPSPTANLAKAVDTATGAVPNIYVNAAATTTLAPFNANVTVQAAGGNQPVPVQSPYIGLNFIIATQGVWPSRP
jgi:microcystin-dependent protein